MRDCKSTYRMRKLAENIDEIRSVGTFVFILAMLTTIELNMRQRLLRDDRMLNEVFPRTKSRRRAGRTSRNEILYQCLNPCRSRDRILSPNALEHGITLPMALI